MLVLSAARAKEYGQDISSKKFGAIIRDLGFRPGKNIKRVGQRKIRVLVFDKRALKHIPEPEEEREKVSKLRDKFRDLRDVDLSLLSELLKPEYRHKSSG